MIIMLVLVVAAVGAMIVAPTRRGITTIVWGTKGVTTGALSAAIVDSARYTPHNFAAEIEDNDGYSVASVDLFDGFDAKLEMLYDTAIVWPAQGDMVTLNRRATAFNCLVVSIEDDLTRKKESHIMIELRYRPGITL